MRKRIILFILPVIALLIMATALILLPAVGTFAKGPSHTHSTVAPTPTKPVHGITPDWSYHF